MGRFISIAAVLIALAPLFAHSAVLPNYNGSLQLGMSPEFPKPGEAVTLTISNYSSSADSTTYTWSVNGKKMLSGIGEKTLTLQAGALGTTQTVSVVAALNGATQDTLTAIIRPADVDMVWEGKTATPPFYIGRPLPNAASQITVLALPHLGSGGSELSANTLIYSWSVNDVPLGSQSGYGKSSVTITPPRFGEAFSVSVHVENTTGALAAQRTTVITPQQPKAAIYEHAPLLGTRFEKNISNLFPFAGDEVSFSAFPLSVGNIGALSYQWTLDGTAFPVDPARPREVTFRKVGAGSGAHTVTFSLNNPGEFQENANASFKLSL